MIQFGGQTPLKLARAIEAAGFKVLGTPYEAVDLAEDRERFGTPARRARACAARSGGSPTRPTAAVEIAGARRLPRARPALVRARRPRDAGLLRRGAGAGRDGRRHGAGARRPLPRRRARDRRRRALRRRLRPHRRGDGARRGGGDPLRRLVLRPAGALARRGRRTREVCRVVRRLGPALGVVGLLNVQLALVDGEVSVLEVNPRASRTVPFASKATGRQPRRRGRPARRRRAPARARAARGAAPGARERQGGRAAVRPLPRLGSRARAGDALDRRGDGERRRPPDRLREGRARRRAGRCRPPGPRSSPSARPTRPGSRRSPRRSPRSASACSRPAARRRRSTAAGLEVTTLEKGDAVVDAIRAGRCDLVVNTPQGSGARRDGALIRQAALGARVPCITTLAGARLAVDAIANARAGDRALPPGADRA